MNKGRMYQLERIKALIMLLESTTNTIVDLIDQI